MNTLRGTFNAFMNDAKDYLPFRTDETRYLEVQFAFNGFIWAGELEMKNTLIKMKIPCKMERQSDWFIDLVERKEEFPELFNLVRQEEEKVDADVPPLHYNLTIRKGEGRSEDFDADLSLMLIGRVTFDIKFFQEHYPYRPIIEPNDSQYIDF